MMGRKKHLGLGKGSVFQDSSHMKNTPSKITTASTAQKDQQYTRQYTPMLHTLKFLTFLETKT